MGDARGWGNNWKRACATGFRSSSQHKQKLPEGTSPPQSLPRAQGRPSWMEFVGAALEDIDGEDVVLLGFHGSHCGGFWAFLRFRGRGSFRTV